MFRLFHFTGVHLITERSCFIMPLTHGNLFAIWANLMELLKHKFVPNNFSRSPAKPPCDGFFFLGGAVFSFDLFSYGSHRILAGNVVLLSKVFSCLTNFVL
jgi:hypothetical protein